MKRITVLMLTLLSGCATLTPAIPSPAVGCQDKDTDKPTAMGYNEHYAHQNRDGTIHWFIQDRAYIHCLTVTKAQRDVTQDEWNNTIKDYRYEEVK